MTIPVPKPAKGDIAHAIAKAAISVVPVVGGPGVELFQALVQPPIEKRRVAWMEQVGEKLRELEERGVDLSALQNDEQFITSVMQASAAAIRTHQQAKLDALKNAIINIALGDGPDETYQHLLLGFVDQFTEMHFRLLAFARAPVPQAGISMGGLGDVLEQNIPSMRGQKTLYTQLWKDLYNRGLVNTDNLHTTMTANGLAENRLSEIGATLLKLISDREV